MFEGIQVTLMGTGTSHGIPVIACNCAVCRSRDRHDTRLRCSAYVTKKEKDGTTTRIVVDTGPEFRIQALKYNIPSLDAVLLTHGHADHFHGLDDVRVFSHTKSCTELAEQKKHPDLVFDEDITPPLRIITNAQTIDDVKRHFDYVFMPTQLGGGKPRFDLVDSEVYTPDNPLVIGSIQILPIPMLHGTVHANGWLFIEEKRDGKKHGIAYLTDCSLIPAESLARITTAVDCLDHVVIDGLRPKPHETHCSFEDAMAYGDKLQAKHTWLTHITHDMCHKDIKRYLKERLANYPALHRMVKAGGSVLPSYDGLVLRTL